MTLIEILQELASYPWPIRAGILTDLSSSLLWHQHNGWMVNTLYLVSPCTTRSWQSSDGYGVINEFLVSGRIHSGMGIIERIGQVETGAMDRPVDDVKIVKAYVDQ